MMDDMKKIILILISALFLTACDNGATASVVDVSNVAKPISQERKPSVPIPGNSEAEKGVDAQVIKPPELNMDRIIKSINENIIQPNIRVEDIERGWYPGGVNDKRVGTPSTWVWVNKGNDSAWISPSSLDESDDDRLDKLCRSTAGSYAFSCIEREFPGCEHIAKSLCRCPELTAWVEKQGCVVTDKAGKSITISSSDLKRGWYYGLPNEKKLDTPVSWVWKEGGKKSRWQTPNPLENN